MRKRKRGLCRIIRLSRYVKENLGVSPAQGKRLRRDDPQFPPLVLIGENRFGVREDDGAEYQVLLQERARASRPVSANLSDPKGAAAKSVAVRRAKAAARKAKAATEALA